MIARAVITIFITSSVVMPLQNAMVSVASAEETGTWIDGDAPSLVVGNKLSDPFPAQCHDDIFYYHSYTKPDGSLDPVGRQVPVNVCARSVGFGEVGDAMIKPGTALAFRVLTTTSFSAGIVPNPRNPGFHFTAPSGAGSYIALFSSLASAGKFEKDSVINQLAYRLNPITVDQFLKDSAGNRISIRGGTTYSSDGTWLVTYADGLGLLRINTLTHETLLFDTQKINFDLGFVPSLELSISDDGSTVIRSGIGNFPQTTKIFDLSECQGTPFINGANNTIPGCRSRLVQDNLATLHPGYVGMANMRFTSDSKSVRGVAAIRNSSGVQEFYSATYSVAGHVIPKVSYLALGDSFSSGEGALDVSDYELGTDESENKCHLSKKSYPYLVAGTLGIGNDDFHSVACSGSKYEHYSDTVQHGSIPNNAFSIEWLPGSDEQRDFLVEAAPDVVTISMIGNDIGFTNKIVRCLMPDSCFHFKEDRESIVKGIDGWYGTLVGLYTDIKDKSSPDVKVYVLGYPQIFSVTGDCRFSVNLDVEEREMAKGLVGYLNAVIRAAAETAGVQYIDVEHTFTGHQLCGTGSEAVNGLSSGNDKALVIGNESFHPNDRGHQLFAEQLLLQSENFTKPMPVPQYKGVPGIGSEAYNNFIGNAPSGGILRRAAYIGWDNATAIIRGGTYTLTYDDQILQHYSPYQVFLYSEPTYVGTVTTDANGAINESITIPSGISPGFHTLHIFAQNVAGEDVDLYQTIYVAASEDDFDGDGVLNENEECLAVEPAGVDEDRDGVDDACDPEISEPPADTTPPLVTGTADRQPNQHGWYNADATINWSSTDPEPSSGAPTIPTPTTATLEGENTYTSDPSCDPLNNCATGSLSLKIDKTAPYLNTPVWTNNPKTTLSMATVTIPSTDNLSGITEAEYYLGDTDPGQGNGATMQVNHEDGTVSVSFNTDFPTGVYKVTVRAKDKAGNWSMPASDYLVVYDPFGTRMTGKRTLLPSLAGGDILSGLISNDQPDKAKFGFNVRYDNDGNIHKNSDFQFKYETGVMCNKPEQATNCHNFELNATSIAWLTTQGQNDSTGILQGIARLSVNGVVSNVIFRLTGLDGELLNSTTQDHLTLKVYPEGENPNTATPIYQVSADVLRGNIKIRKW